MSAENETFAQTNASANAVAAAQAPDDGAARQEARETAASAQDPAEAAARREAQESAADAQAAAEEAGSLESQQAAAAAREAEQESVRQGAVVVQQEADTSIRAVLAGLAGGDEMKPHSVRCVVVSEAGEVRLCRSEGQARNWGNAQPGPYALFRVAGAKIYAMMETELEDRVKGYVDSSGGSTGGEGS